MDSASNDKDARIGIVLTTLEGCIIEQSYTLGFRATNNEVEYETVIACLKMVATIEIAKLEVHCDSLLIVSQVNKEYTLRQSDGRIPEDRYCLETQILSLQLHTSPKIGE